VIHIDNEILRMSYLETKNHEEDVVLFLSSSNSLIDEYKSAMNDLKTYKDNLFCICPEYQDEAFSALCTTLFYQFERSLDPVNMDNFLLQLLIYIVNKCLSY